MTHRILVPLLTAALFVTGCGHHDADTTDEDPETPTPSVSSSPTPTPTPSAIPRVKKARPRGLDKATYPVKNPASMSVPDKVMARFVVMANSPDTRVDNAPEDRWRAALNVCTKDSTVLGDLDSARGVSTQEWWNDARRHDGWVSVNISHIVAEEAQSPDDEAPGNVWRVMFTTTLHRDDGTITEKDPHIWIVETATSNYLSITDVDMFSGPSTIVPWWRMPKISFPITTSDGHVPSDRDLLTVRAGWTYTNTANTIDPKAPYPGFDTTKLYSLTTGEERVSMAYSIRDWRNPRGRDVAGLRSSKPRSASPSYAKVTGSDSVELGYHISSSDVPDHDPVARISTDLCPGTDDALCVSHSEGVL